MMGYCNIIIAKGERLVMRILYHVMYLMKGKRKKDKSYDFDL